MTPRHTDRNQPFKSDHQQTNADDYRESQAQPAFLKIHYALLYFKYINHNQEKTQEILFIYLLDLYM